MSATAGGRRPSAPLDRRRPGPARGRGDHGADGPAREHGRRGPARRRVGRDGVPRAARLPAGLGGDDGPGDGGRRGALLRHLPGGLRPGQRPARADRPAARRTAADLVQRDGDRRRLRPARRRRRRADDLPHPGPRRARPLLHPAAGPAERRRPDRRLASRSPPRSAPGWRPSACRWSTSTSRSTGVPSVAIDDVAGARDGVRGAAAPRATAGSASSARRCAAPASATAPTGGSRASAARWPRPASREADQLVIDAGDLDAGDDVLARALADPDPPTALAVDSDELAIAILAALVRVGLRAPDDLSLLGFDDHAMAAGLGLSTVAQPAARHGDRGGHAGARAGGGRDADLSDGARAHPGRPAPDHRSTAAGSGGERAGRPGRPGRAGRGQAALRSAVLLRRAHAPRRNVPPTTRRASRCWPTRSTTGCPTPSRRTSRPATSRTRCASSPGSAARRVRVLLPLLTDGAGRSAARTGVGRVRRPGGAAGRSARPARADDDPAAGPSAAGGRAGRLPRSRGRRPGATGSDAAAAGTTGRWSTRARAPRSWSCSTATRCST